VYVPVRVSPVPAAPETMCLWAGATMCANACVCVCVCVHWRMRECTHLLGEELVKERPNALRNLLKRQCAAVVARKPPSNVQQPHVEATSQAHVKYLPCLLEGVLVRRQRKAAAAHVETGHPTRTHTLSALRACPSRYTHAHTHTPTTKAYMGICVYVPVCLCVRVFMYICRSLYVRTPCGSRPGGLTSRRQCAGRAPWPCRASAQTRAATRQTWTQSCTRPQCCWAAASAAPTVCVCVCVSGCARVR
jgi:hypothetical protein